MIDVLLATYRPDKSWLDAQVESIRRQQEAEVRLIMREDVDGRGPCDNFNELLKMSGGDYVALADQDDVWVENRLATMMERMRQMEGKFGKETPILVFCDSRVVDENLRPMHGTFISRRGIDVDRGIKLSRLLMQNFISGHAMLFNAALRAKVGDIPASAIMHDHWIALVAAAFGKIGFVDEPLVLYRQHSRNVLSANSLSRSLQSFKARLAEVMEQAKAFIGRYGEECPPCVGVLARMGKTPWLRRRIDVVRYGLFKHGLKRNLFLLAFI